MNSDLNWLVALIMATALSACATGGTSPADTAVAQPTGAASSAPSAAAQPSSKSAIIEEPGCD